MTLEDFNLRDHYFTKQRGMNGKKNRVIVRQDEIKFKKMKMKDIIIIFFGKSSHSQ